MVANELSLTLDPPRIFYTLTKIDKPRLFGRPIIIPGCSGTTERISAFVDHLIQPIAPSYLRDTTDLAVPYLFQRTSQAYTRTYHNERVLALYAMHTKSLIRTYKKNSFQFNGKDYLQRLGTAMGTKMAVAFANIFMAKIEKEILGKSSFKPIFWKRFIDDVISAWDTSKNEIE